MRSRAKRRGATLLEAVSAILVLSIAIPPLLTLFRQVAVHGAAHTYQRVALTYAESLMEEIVSKTFEDPDEPAGSFGAEEASRSLYDDVDDFDGLSSSPPERLDGTLLDDYGGFTQSVFVDNVTGSDPDPGTAEPDGSTDYKRIRVTVAWTGAGGGEVTLETLRTNLAAGAPTGPLDEVASAASAQRVSTKKFEVDLVSISTSDVVLASFELSADAPTTAAKRLKLENKQIWLQGSGLALPTGLTALNHGSAADRTVPAGQSPVLEYEAQSPPSGTIEYTLVLYFVDGSVSTLVFSIAW